MRTNCTLLLLMLALGPPALADPAGVDPLRSLEGRYGFNWLRNPAKERCVRITDAMLKGFRKNYTCVLEEKTESASGHPHVVCTWEGKKREYLIFKTKAHCDDERETQMAHGEEP
jgi:hypothetical protein